MGKKKNTKKKKLDKKAKTIKYLSRSLIIVLLLICLFIGYYIVSVKIYKNTNYKYRPYISIHAISSPSMSPQYNVDDVVVDYVVKDPKKIKVGDVITFIPDNHNDNTVAITHRVVQVVEKNGVYFYRTKGDNASTNDSSLVSFDNVLGKVMLKVPYVGKIQL